MIGKKPKILLIYPSVRPENPGIDIEDEVDKSVPIGLMSIASILEKEGYTPKIIDARIFHKIELLKIIKSEVKDTICVGLSVMTPQIRHALQLSNFIKDLDKDIPIIWGGIHPILFSEQTIQDTNVDFVIQAEGEYILLDLVRYLEEGKPRLDEIDGLGYKIDRKVRLNKLNFPIDVAKLPRPAYHLLDIEKYIDRTLANHRRIRGLDIHTSRGCPYRCTFCTNPILSFGKWRALPAERVLEDIDFLVNTYNLNHLWIMDDYFFGAKDRALYIVKGLIERGYKLFWEANIRADDFSPQKINDEFLKLLRKSGCYALRIGAESGSDRILGLLKKDITVSQTINAVKQCSRYGIIPICFFMTGIPGETFEEVRKTFSFIWRLQKMDPEVVLLSPGTYRPYPGGKLYNKCKELGLTEPQDLEGWKECNSLGGYLDLKNFPWIKHPQVISDLQTYTRWMLTDRRNVFKAKFSWLWKILGKLAKLRCRYNFWGIRIEPRIISNLRKIRCFLRIFVDLISRIRNIILRKA